jgi:hypothetical protein
VFEELKNVFLIKKQALIGVLKSIDKQKVLAPHFDT